MFALFSRHFSIFSTLFSTPFLILGLGTQFHTDYPFNNYTDYRPKSEPTGREHYPEITEALWALRWGRIKRCASIFQGLSITDVNGTVEL
jgi:hypothetical protein